MRARQKAPCSNVVDFRTQLRQLSCSRAPVVLDSFGQPTGGIWVCDAAAAERSRSWLSLVMMGSPGVESRLVGRDRTSLTRLKLELETRLESSRMEI